MSKRSRMTEMEAYATRTRQSEPIGSRGKGTLLLERKASGSIMAYYRERIEQSDKRMPLGTLSKKPTPGTNEHTLSEVRAEALRISTEVESLGSLETYLALKIADETEIKNVPIASASWRGSHRGERLESYLTRT